MCPTVAPKHHTADAVTISSWKKVQRSSPAQDAASERDQAAVQGLERPLRPTIPPCVDIIKQAARRKNGAPRLSHPRWLDLDSTFHYPTQSSCGMLRKRDCKVGICLASGYLLDASSDHVRRRFHVDASRMDCSARKPCIATS